MTRPARKRSRASAKAAGARFERLIADHLAEKWDDRIDRKVSTGSRDTGDIANFRTHDGRRITVECKNERGTRLGPWWSEATTERDNAGDDHALIIHKRHGEGYAGKQWVTLTLDELLHLLTDTTTEEK